MVSFIRKNFDWLCIITIFLLVWVLRLAVLWKYPIPLPFVTDELEHILGAKTFALGRLSNPPIPKELIDSLLEISVLPEPTRMMKPQPAMAGFMALGIKLFGDAYWGVVLLMSLAIASSYWGVRGWLGSKASLVVAAVFLFAMRAPHYFMQSYFGGGHAMLGAFLIIGAYPRIFYRKEYKYAWIAMVGAVILLLSRPYEGIVLILSASICGIVNVCKNFSKEEVSSFFKKVSLPVLLLGFAFLCFQLVYNKAITGDYLKLPYVLYSEKNDVQKTLWIFPRHEELKSDHYGLRAYQDYDANIASDRKKQIFLNAPYSIAGLLGFDKYGRGVEVLSLAILFYTFCIILFATIKSRELNFLHVAFILQSVALSLITWLHLSHYFTVWFVLYFIIMANIVEQFSIKSNKNKKITILICAALFLLMVKENYYHKRPENEARLEYNIKTYLQASPHKHIVFVDLKKNIKCSEIDVLNDLSIYNEPDLESSKIIWAWDFSPEQNKKLINAYPNRKVWYFNPPYFANPAYVFKPYDKIYNK